MNGAIAFSRPRRPYPFGCREEREVAVQPLKWNRSRSTMVLYPSIVIWTSAGVGSITTTAIRCISVSSKNRSLNQRLRWRHPPESFGPLLPAEVPLDSLATLLDRAGGETTTRANCLLRRRQFASRGSMEAFGNSSIHGEPTDHPYVVWSKAPSAGWSGFTLLVTRRSNGWHSRKVLPPVPTGPSRSATCDTTGLRSAARRYL